MLIIGVAALVIRALLVFFCGLLGLGVCTLVGLDR